MAFGSPTFSDAGGAVSDLFAAEGYKLKAQGNRLEAHSYEEAAASAERERGYAKTASEIKQTQLERSIYQTIGSQEAGVAGSGFTEGGTALDLLRDSAQQGALSHAAVSVQAAITDESYAEQARAYNSMAQSSLIAASAQDKARQGAYWSAGIKGAAAVGTLFV